MMCEDGVVGCEVPLTGDPYFEGIRPYLDSEVPAVLRELLGSAEVIGIVRHFFGPLSESELEQMMAGVDGVNSFKKRFLAPVADKIRKASCESLTISGCSHLDRSGGEKYLFISNHRDIILDSAFLNLMMLEHGLSLPRMAIGDNLLIMPWIEQLVRLAGAFIVKRHPSIREMLQESKRLSSYIRSSILHGEESVWLAQSEGRRKNSDDRTQTAILKMLSLSSKERDLAKALTPLHITPMSISYEYDPCDYLKAQEMQEKRDNPEWKKSALDDLQNMRSGLEGNKGRVHIAIGTPLRDLEGLLEHTSTPKDALQVVASEIDRQIFLGYRFYPCNYIAYDLLYGGGSFGSMYSTKERAAFELYLEGQMEKIKVSSGQKDSTFLRGKLLEMYAMPLRNHLKTKGEIR